MSVFDGMGIPRKLSETNALLDVYPFHNSAVEAATRAECKRIADGVVVPIQQAAQESLTGCDAEAGEHAQETGELRTASKDLRRRIKRREISAKDALRELDKLRRAAIVLDQKRTAIVAHYETQLYIRDHAADYADVLFDKYPSLEKPRFPI